MTKLSQFALFVGLLVLVWSGAQDVLAQTGIEGRVVEAETNEPLPGATVQVEETGQGAATNASGQFEFTGMEPGTYTVLVSFVGFEEAQETVQVVQGEMAEVEIVMGAAERALDELVVTGYSVQPRREVTGAISSVSGEDFARRNIQTPDEALQGRSAGFQMVGGSGAPGSQALVRIRGTGSIQAGNDPLYIIDGVQLESTQTSSQGGGSILAGINPRDIESIEVLRDAEATAIYGAQGANGVVLITTRRGEPGATQFNLSMQAGQSEQVNFYELLEGPEWVEFLQEAYGNEAELLGQGYEAGVQEAIETYGAPDEVQHYDWQEAMHQYGTQQRVDLSASGGVENTQFFVSGGYQQSQGTAIGTGFDRINFRTNLDHQPTDRLSFEANVNLARSEGSGVAEHGNYINAPFHGGVSTRPTAPIWANEELGVWNQEGLGLSYNMVQVLHEQERIGRTLQAIGNVAGMYQITSELNVRTNWGVDYRVVRDRDHRPATIPGYSAYGGQVNEIAREVQNWNANLVLNYNTSFEDVHNVSALVGTEYRDMWRSNMQSVGRGFPNPLFNVLSMTSENYSIGGSTTEYSTAGLFTRGQYNYDQRYFVSGSVRYDGHSRFGEDRRWGLFYSGALAWDAAQEPFLQDVDWLTQLRPRFSYGVTGNANIGNFPARALFGSGNSYGGQGGLRPTQLANADLTWEEAETMDIAVDFAFLQDRVYGSAGVFRNQNQRLLLDRFLPIESGFSGITENVGTVQNEGIEIELGAVLLDVADFRWRSDFNITFLRSEIVDLADDQQTVNSNVRLGYPREIYWGYEYAGVNPADGKPMYLDEDDNLVYSPVTADQRQIGSPEPDYYGGFSNTLSYGPVSLDVFFQYEIGADVQDITYHAFLMAPYRGRALHRDVLERWQEPGDVTHIPMAYAGSSIEGARNHTAVSSLRMQDGSYVRLKSMQLNYQLPQRFSEMIGVGGMNVFLQGENLLTWTEYSGVDPEVVNTGAGTSGARTNQAVYPQPRSFTGGLEVQF